MRHGRTEWSEAGRFAGRTDLALTDAGRAEAIAARSKLDGFQFERVFASPLSRARHTAELLALAPLTLDTRLRERDYGDYEGMTTQQIRAVEPAWDVWTSELPNGEPIDAMTARVDAFLQDLHQLDAKTVGVVAHAHLIRLLTARWLGLPAAQAGLFRLSTLGLVHLGWERTNPVIHKWNV